MATARDVSYVTEQRLMLSVVATVEGAAGQFNAARPNIDGEKVMTLYMLFAGLGISIFTGVALAEEPGSGFSSAHLAFGLQFAFFASMSILLAAVIFFYANRLLRERSSSIGRASTSRRPIVATALVFFAGGGAVLIAASQPGDALTCAGQCEAGREPIAGETGVILPNGSRAAVVGSESARALAAGATLFQERGCVGCHQPDGTGVGPTLHGLFGSPVEEWCGLPLDESYLREAILNPSAIAAVGFPPVMPTFAGQLTEEELQALIVYVKSLSVPVEVQRR